MAILAYCLVMGVITLTKFHLGLDSLFDLGIFPQVKKGFSDGNGTQRPLTFTRPIR